MVAQEAAAATRDSFWGNAEEKAKAGGAAAHRESARHKDTSSGDALAAKAEPQPVTPKPPPEKVEDEGDDDVFEDDEDEDDLLPEAQPSFPRNEVDKDKVTFRQNAVHVYGLDFLKTGHMDEIFSQFNHKFVEWINDSSANIVFSDAASAKKALESLSFAKTGDDPWRRTPDILVSEDVPPIFLQMRLAASTDVKPSKRSVPKAMPPAPYSQPRRPDGYASRRQQMYSDGAPAAGGAEPRGRRAAKRPPNKAEISEEELLKRRKRAERFGEVQPGSGLVSKAEAAEEPAEPPAAAAAGDKKDGEGLPPPGEEGSKGGEPAEKAPASAEASAAAPAEATAAPGEAAAPGEKAAEGEPPASEAPA